VQTPFIGQIFIFAGNFAPASYQFCNGQLLSINNNQALFSILGTTYGGDGQNTFALPNLQSRAPIGAGQGPGLGNFVLGQLGGTENVTLTSANLPSHSHAIGAVAATGNVSFPQATLFAIGAKPDLYSGSGGNTTMNAAMVSPVGSGAPFSHLRPYLAMSYIIAIYGVFPTRN
jgi:microcystin-dependent protein